MSDDIEIRLETLELQVQDIIAKLCSREPKTVGSKDWRKSLGMFDNRPSMKEIDQAGRLIRQQERFREHTGIANRGLDKLT